MNITTTAAATAAGAGGTNTTTATAAAGGGTNTTTTRSANPSPDVSHLLQLHAAVLFSWKVWPPFLLLLGAFGNVATIVVMRRIKGRHSSQHVILISLAVADLTFLFTGLLRLWLLFLVEVDVRFLHTALCKLHLWLVHVSSTASAWLLTCVTAQRAVAVIWPHRMRVICTVRRTWVIVAVLVVTACGLHLHLLPGMELVQVKEEEDGDSLYTECKGNSPEYLVFREDVFPWLDTCLSTLLPTACLLVCDVILSLTLFRTVSGSAVGLSNAETAGRSSNSNSRSNNSDARRKTASRTTVMILALSFTFLLLTLPMHAYLIWNNYVIHNAAFSVPLFVKRVLFWSVGCLLLYANSAVNFFLYCLTGTRFRQEFLTWLKCGGFLPHRSSKDQTTTVSSQIPK